MKVEYKEFKRKKKNILFKKRVLKDDKLATFTRIMLLIKLRVL